MIRILQVEDDVWVRKGVRQALTPERTGLSIVAQCGTAQEALDALAGGLAFEVALVDLGLPDRSGTEVIRAVRRTRPEATALAFTVFDDAATVFEALKAGACGYLLKDTPELRLAEAIREAHRGGAPMTPSIARLVVQSFSAPRTPDDPAAESLTPRERDVLERLTRGESYAAVASNLGVSLSTIQGHVKSIYRKLEVNSKAAATAVALSRGLVSI